MTPRRPFHWSNRKDDVPRWAWVVLLGLCFVWAGVIASLFK